MSRYNGPISATRTPPPSVAVETQWCHSLSQKADYTDSLKEAEVAIEAWWTHNNTHSRKTARGRHKILVDTTCVAAFTSSASHLRTQMV